MSLAAPRRMQGKQRGQTRPFRRSVIRSDRFPRGPSEASFYFPATFHVTRDPEPTASRVDGLLAHSRARERDWSGDKPGCSACAHLFSFESNVPRREAVEYLLHRAISSSASSLASPRFSSFRPSVRMTNVGGSVVFQPSNSCLLSSQPLRADISSGISFAYLRVALHLGEFFLTNAWAAKMRQQ